MNKFKKIIPALCMLLVSAVMLGGTTFAWFSINKSVTAGGMSVTAKSDTTYLMISKAKNDAAVNPFGTSVTFSGKKEVLPCAYTTEDLMESEVKKVDANNWYTAVSGSSNSATANVSGYKKVDLATDADTYFLVSTVYLKLSDESIDYTGKLTVSFTRSSGDAAVKAMVMVGDEQIRLDSASGEASEQTANNVTIKKGGAADADALEVKIYVYIDGTSTNVNTNYFNTAGNTLEGSVSIGFAIA